VGLPASRRLKRHGEFARVKAEGNGQKGRYLVVNVLQTGGRSPSRCGIITGRKIGNAVHRNRVRRRLREILRHEGDRIAAGLMVVIIARWNATQATMDQLKADWSRCAHRAGIYQDKTA
jgi:ribonuclease P protein component